MIKIGLFSGRFDPPNAGHFMTIAKLISEYHYLLIPILNYPERDGCTAEQAKAIFEYLFSLMLPDTAKNKVKFIINNDHFGHITKEKLNKLLKQNGLLWEQVTYLAGNYPVLQHIRHLGMKSVFVKRVEIPGIDQYAFESTRIRSRMAETGEKLEDIYNIISEIKKLPCKKPQYIVLY